MPNAFHRSASKSTEAYLPVPSSPLLVPIVAHSSQHRAHHNLYSDTDIDPVIAALRTNVYKKDILLVSCG